jgi:ATP-binding protein involved in chromosome partitioning
MPPRLEQAEIIMKNYYDIVGDGGSGILEQVTARDAEIARRLAGVRHRVAIGSGKGGVGKSTLTMLLARTLRRQGARVAILDADLNGPSQARLAGLRDAPLVPVDGGFAMPRNHEGIGVISIGTMLPETQALKFDSVAGGSSHHWRTTREFSAMASLLAAVEWGPLDYLLIDLPPGAERTVQYAEFFGRDTAFVLVTIPSDLARGVVARSVAALGDMPNPVLGYVENMKGYYCADCDSVKPLFAGGGNVDLGLPCLGSVPFDPRLAAACDAGESLTEDPSHPSVAAVQAVAAALCGRLETRP